jgi:glutamyl-Q tRNA(Asp) synthetase
VRDETGRKLSKSDHARPVDASDPLPALRAALDFLGIGATSSGDVGNVLAAAVPAWSARHPVGPQVSSPGDTAPTFVDPA